VTTKEPKTANLTAYSNSTVGSTANVLIQKKLHARTQLRTFLWPPYEIGQAIIFLPCGFFLLSSFFLSFSSPNLSGRRSNVYYTSTHDCGLSANLECRSEMCCTRPAGNTGRKNRHFGTIEQLCGAISSEIRNVSTIRKQLVKCQYLLHVC